MRQYQPEAWRNAADVSSNGDVFAQRQRSHPDVRDQSLILELLGRINYRIVKGDRVYVETGGVVYKTLYGGYWRSVFTGIEHYLLKCERVQVQFGEMEATRPPLLSCPSSFRRTVGPQKTIPFHSCCREIDQQRQ